MKTTSLEQSLRISNMCQDILSIYPKIYFSCYINRNGRIVESKLCDDGLITDLTSQELEMKYMQCKLQSSMNKEFEDKLGHLDYTLICRKSTYEFIFPFHEGAIFVIVDKEIPIQSIDKKILHMLNIFEFGSDINNFWWKMPDSSCRNCGNNLYVFLKCVECRIIYQEICLKCGKKTLPKYHDCIVFQKLNFVSHVHSS